MNFKSSFLQAQRLASDFHWKSEESHFWSTLFELYNLHLTSFRSSSINEYLIPKKIHQIWIGGNLPRRYQTWADSIQRINPQYEYKLWDEKSILDLGLTNEYVFIKNTNPGIKSDIARYEILSRFGGLYLDTDFEAIRPFDNFLHCNDFVSCLVFDYKPQIANGFLGCSINSPFMNLLVANIPQDLSVSLSPLQVLDFYGANYLTNLLKSHHELLMNALILPSQYFYPWPNFLRHSKDLPSTFITDHTYAIHHWQISWAKHRNPLKALFKKFFQTLNF